MIKCNRIRSKKQNTRKKKKVYTKAAFHHVLGEVRFLRRRGDGVLQI